jgi:hypothetical protein
VSEVGYCAMAMEFLVWLFVGDFLDDGGAGAGEPEA